ncbi:iron-sulfur cluster assembly protein IscA [Candidatus Gillettellia adelgis]
MSITISNSAAQRIKTFINKRGRGLGLRVAVKISGCSGMAYALELVDEVQHDDIVFKDKDVKVIIDSKSLVYLSGTELDFVKNGINEGFQFNNPNVSSHCGCGKSFNVS